MSAHPPPVPPEQQSKRGPDDAAPERSAPDTAKNAYRQQERNLDEQGRQGNVRQNTTNKGLQQDR